MKRRQFLGVLSSIPVVVQTAKATGYAGPGKEIVSFSVSEEDGIARKPGFVEQGIPLPPMKPEEISQLAVVDKSGHLVRAGIEPDGHDPAGRVRWLRLSLSAELKPWERRAFTLVSGLQAPAPPALHATSTGGKIIISGEGFTATFGNPDYFQLRNEASILMDGRINFQVYPDARSIINDGGDTTVLSNFQPSGFQLDRTNPWRATVILSGRYPKQKHYSYKPGEIEPELGFDIDLRFHFSSLTRTIHFEWRLVNQCGYRAFLERFVVVLPIREGALVESSERNAAARLGHWAVVLVGTERLGVTAPFVDDLGRGTGMRIEPAGLMIGGLDMPPDASLAGPVPEIHRLFYYGMSRTFSGALVLDGAARAEVSRLDLRLPAQYYSDTGVLPERGDPVTDGEFHAAVQRSAEWLLAHQWRGTLWCGEWWREWDLARQQGTEEVGSANSVLGPLYYYFRTGDRRFLLCAERSARYALDVQQDKRRTGFGPMLHCRRWLLDQIDWIHPRYQRAYGTILASHVLLLSHGRRELIETVRNFSEKIQAPDGVPYDWDPQRNQRSPNETGVDTANFIQALVAAWEETGDPFFLDRARGYARWTITKWRTRTLESFWNWNLTRYVETGMLAICLAAKEYPDAIPEGKEFLECTLEISRHTMNHPELGFVPGTLGGGGLEFFFYHSSLDAAISRLVDDPSLLRPLLTVIRREIKRQNSEGGFPLDLGSLWSQYPTWIISFYGPKAVVEDVPVLSARLAAIGASAACLTVPVLNRESSHASSA